MNIECRNAQNRFDKPILSVFVNSNECHLNSLDIHCNGYSQIFFENLLPNLRFGVEIVNIFTISTFYNHYNCVSFHRNVEIQGYGVFCTVNYGVPKSDKVRISTHL